MGKDWLYWMGGGGGGGSRGSSARRRRMPREMRDAAAVSGGCMRAVFQLFDFPSNHHHHNLSHFHSTNCNNALGGHEAGLEAPRNSLELNPDSVLSSRKEESSLHLPARIKIKTGRLSSTSRTDDFSSESSSNSPAGVKTPSVVARLMGLDLLPDSSNSPRISSASSTSRQRRNFRNILLTRRTNRAAFSQDDISVGTGTAHSLPPETPRMSLQINNKENNNISDEPPSIRARRFRFQPQDETRSPGHYARQIVKQVKESVGRRVGLDITNTTTRNNKDLTRRDENLILLKPTNKKPKTLSPEIGPHDGLNFKSGTATKSPRDLTSDSKQTSTKPQAVIEQNKKVLTTGKHNSSGVKKLPFQATRKKKEEAFVRPTATTSKSDRKSKKTEIIHISSPTLLQAKKDPSPPLTKLPQKQLSSKQSHSYGQSEKRPTVKETVHPDNGGAAKTPPPGAAAADYGSYIRRILILAGVDENSTALITSVKSEAPSHPIDPLIFHRIELFHLSSAVPTAALSRRCNRKLIFQLVDELLREILKSYFSSKPWDSSAAYASNRQLPLVEQLCRRIDGFPSAKCLVLEDIDSLIDKDLRGEQWDEDLEEERAAIAQEIEDEIVEQLVRETVATVWRPGAGATGGGAEKDRRNSRAAIHVR